jgi:hypothetical protein
VASSVLRLADLVTLVVCSLLVPIMSLEVLDKVTSALLFLSTQLLFELSEVPMHSFVLLSGVYELSNRQLWKPMRKIVCCRN